MKIALVDLETTGLDYQFSNIVEIAIVRLDLDHGSIKTLFNHVVRERSFNPLRDKHAWIFNNSTLTVEDVENAKSLDFYRDDIQRILDNFSITAFNKDIDLSFLRSRGFQIRKEYPCVMKVATGILKIPHYNYGFKYPNLVELWYYYNKDTPYSEKHRALDDVTKTAQLLHQMHQNGDYEPREYANPNYKVYSQ